MKNIDSLNEHPGAYRTNLEHMNDVWVWLDLKLRGLLARRSGAEDQDHDPWRGLAMSDAEAYALLDGRQPQEAGQEPPEIRELRRLANGQASMIRARLERSREQGGELPLSRLSRAFSLTPWEESWILICLAPEVDRKYGKLFGFCLDDMTCRHPSVDLILELLCDSAEERMDGLRYFADPKPFVKMVLRPLSGGESRPETLLSTPLRLDERVIRALLGTDTVDARIRSFVRCYKREELPPPLLSGEDMQRRITDFMQRQGEGQQRLGPRDMNQVIRLKGMEGTGKTLQVRHACRSLGLDVLVVDVSAMLTEETPFDVLLLHTVREAFLQQAALCFCRCEALTAEEAGARKRWDVFLRGIESRPGWAFLLSDGAWQPLDVDPVPEIEIPLPDDSARQRIWQTLASAYPVHEDVDWGYLGSCFRFAPDRIARSLAIARQLADWCGPQTGITMEDLMEACSREARHKLDRKAVRLQPSNGWEDLILPADQLEQLQNACRQIRLKSFVYGEWGFERRLPYGRGVSMLFTGPPGTGKTMAAEVTAGELGLPIYKIDLSRLVSKYIGETEKHLSEVFHEAQLSHAILFFDECDALFGKRSEVKEAHDKYANLETSFLLQKMEEYEGITVMTTNFLQNIDEAFMRRITYVIKFTLPDCGQRERIWNSLFPKQTPLHPEVDFAVLAEKWPVAGGHIKNIVLASAYLAAAAGGPVRMRHIITAARLEYQKIGKLLPEGELAEYLDAD
ncbi:ATP-dependent 26S proteasome regulatory subunit [Paenibacillus mucilaginosus]|uniref:ATP-binding protein n=1 Tax=Paenibacillus mucilaginosus TaxID=61624 RepID=UPI003D2396AB